MERKVTKTLTSLFIAIAIYSMISLVLFFIPMEIKFSWWLAPALYAQIILVTWSFYNINIWK